MYNTFGLEVNVQNIYKVCFPFISEKEIVNLNDLKLPYFKFLEKQQPDCPVNYSDSIFILENEIEEKLKNAYSIGVLDDLKQSILIGEEYNLEEKIKRINKVIKALEILKKLDEDLFSLLTTTIHSIFIRNYNQLLGTSGTHGGSSSGAIGVIWLTVNDNVTEYDLVELLIHELTHNLIFIDELNRPQFVYNEIKKKENYAHSSILTMNRPLDKVVHSIIVAAELLLTREKLMNFDYVKNIHPETVVMRKNILNSIESVKNMKNIDDVLMPRGKELVQICENLIF
jgi:hypothetical protein